MRRRFLVVASLQMAALVWVSVYRWESVPATESLRWPISALVWLLPFAWLLRSADMARAVRRMPLVALLAWSMWYLVAVNWSPDYPPALGFSLGILSTTLATSWFVSHFGWHRLARIVAVTLAVFLAVGVAYRLADGSFFGQKSRFFGIGNNPTDTGRQAGIMAIAGLAGFQGRRFYQALFIVGGTAMALLAIAKTALAGLIIALCYVAYLSAGRRARFRMVMVAAVLVAVLGFMGTRIGESDVEADDAADPLSASSALTFTGRTEVWSITADLILQQPLTGHGTGSSTQLYGDQIGDGWLSWRVTTAHNLWLQSLLEHGMIGFSALILAVVSIVRGAMREPVPAREAMLIYLALNSLTETLVQYPGLPLLFLAAAAGMLSYRHPGTDRPLVEDVDDLDEDETPEPVARPLLVSVP